MGKSKIRGLDQLKNEIQGLEQEFEHNLQQAQAKVEDGLLREVQALTPVDTGALKASERIEGDRLVVGGGSVDYASAVEADQHFIAQAVQRYQSDAVSVVKKEMGA